MKKDMNMPLCWVKESLRRHLSSVIHSEMSEGENRITSWSYEDGVSPSPSTMFYTKRLSMLGLISHPQSESCPFLEMILYQVLSQKRMFGRRLCLVDFSRYKMNEPFPVNYGNNFQFLINFSA